MYMQYNKQAIGIKKVNDTYPVNVRRIFSKKITPITISKYELKSIIWFANGIVASPGMAASAVDTPTAATVNSVTVTFLSSKAWIELL